MEQLADDFWTFRGSFRVFGILQIGTQMSLVRRGDGSFVLLDSYDLDDSDKAALLKLTDGGRAVSAILNVHPFHTLHCKAVHELLPHARLIGTRRHKAKQPGLPWEDTVIEDTDTQVQFADTFDFSVPDGVVFIPDNESIHVASVLVRHRDSGIVHVDDTLNVFSFPPPMSWLMPKPRLRFHPMLASGLEKRAGAADDYAGWARQLADSWGDARIVCAAHSAIHRLVAGGFRTEVMAALEAVEPVLETHRRRYG